MILIADSGSTKTQWCLADNEKRLISIATQGINPYFQSEEDIFKILKIELLPFLNSPLVELQIFFYGAGCGSTEKNKLMKIALTKTFSEASIEVNNDLLGAARALCGKEKGIAAILGTGSNTCYFDGEKIAEHPESSGLGYILGDEGSGAHIGKTFIQAYLNKELPTIIAEKFYQSFKLKKEDILNAVYKKPMPNRFLASFSTFVNENSTDEYLRDLVINCFNQFFDKHVCKYPQHKNVPLNCVGSVAFNFRTILQKVAHTKGVAIGKIITNPIDDLTRYHLELLSH
jgi:N-acetylglucosamine kinase-like BadF-type ATPase